MTTTRIFAYRPSVLALSKTCKTIILLFFSICLIQLVSAATPLIYEAERVDQKPSLKKPVHFKISSAMRKRGAEITLRFVVNSEGKVENICIVKFSDPDLVEPAYSAYEKAVYEPGLKNGAPVDTWVTVTEPAE